MLTEGDLDRGRPLDVKKFALQRWSADGATELRPDYCQHGHPLDKLLVGWRPGWGRSHECMWPVGDSTCGSIQYRY